MTINLHRIQSILEFWPAQQSVGTQTDDTDTSDYYKIDNKIRINVLSLDFHGIESLNASANISTDRFFVPEKVEKIEGEEYNLEFPHGGVDCEGIKVYGAYKDIKKLDNYGGKDITWTFDTWKIIRRHGRNWLYISFTPKWEIKEVADMSNQTELTSKMITFLQGRMKLAQGWIKSLLDKSETDAEKKKEQEAKIKKMMFKAAVLERKCATQLEWKEHMEKVGDKMIKLIRKLSDDLEAKKITLEQAETKIEELALEMTVKESEYQKSLKRFMLLSLSKNEYD